MNKCNEASVLAAGNSDHLGVIITKYSKEIKQRPRTTKKRIYTDFNSEDFIREIKYTKFDEILDTTNPNTAVEAFTRIFSSLADNHETVKIFQTRLNYVPWVSAATKELMKERNTLQNASKSSADTEIVREYKHLNKADK